MLDKRQNKVNHNKASTIHLPTTPQSLASCLTKLKICCSSKNAYHEKEDGELQSQMYLLHLFKIEVLGAKMATIKSMMRI